MIIYGAGMAGLLAGNMLRRFDPVIYEAQSELPNNHAALLRFRSDAASKVTNIPFKKVKVQKAIQLFAKQYNEPMISLSNMYSDKVTDKVIGRSIANLDDAERFIAPDHFIDQMSKGLNIEFNSKLTKATLDDQLTSLKIDMISTIPMPMLMDMVDWPDKPEFKWKPIWSVWGKIKKPETDVYQTIYFPDKNKRYYRASITGDTFIVEYISPPQELTLESETRNILWHAFGIEDAILDGLKIKRQEYGKLLPIDEQARKEFILYMTDKYRVYSLGRFATWRQILLDDIVDDVKRIERFVEQRDHYTRRLER